MKPTSVLIIIALLMFHSVSGYAGRGCDYLNEIAIRGLNFRLTEQELAKWDTGEDTIVIKKKFVDELLRHPEFIGQMILVLRFQFLKGTTEEEVYRQIEKFDVLSLMLPLDMDDEQEKALYEDERARLMYVYNLYDNFEDGKLTFEDTYRLFFDNFIYDGQNMGVDNYVFSTFQYALGRKPTESEFRQARAMYFNSTGYLFFKQGQSKDDYLKILTTSDNFLEYQVGYWYYYFLLDFPDVRKKYEIMAELKRTHDEITLRDIIEYILIYEI